MRYPSCNLSSMGGVYLHIGLGKTGTTAVQFWLDANRERLASHGWHYPKIGFFERGRAHHALSHKWGGWISPNLLDGRDIDAEWRQLANTILTSEDNFIVSSENFATAARSNAQVVPFITRTLQGIDTKIILYLRRPDELAEAVYRQMVKAGLTLQPIDRFIEELPPEFDFEAVIQDWEEGFGKQNVIVRWYQPERWPEGDIVQARMFVLLPLLSEQSSPVRSRSGASFTKQSGRMPVRTSRYFAIPGEPRS